MRIAAAASNTVSLPTPASERTWLGLALFALLLTSGAHAQAGATPAPASSATAPASPSASQTKPDDAALAQAREAFQRGVQASSRHDYATAAQRFREALAIHYAPAAAFNLASALYELQQSVEAYNLVLGVLAAPDTPDNVRTRAEELARTLELEVARLTVATSGPSDDLTVQVDGKVLDPAQLGQPQAVAPGPHEVLAVRAGQVIFRRNVEIALRTNALVEVSLIVTEASASAPVAAEAPEPERDDRTHDRKRKILWWSIGAGAAVVVAAVVITAVVLGGKDEQHAAPLPGDTGVLTW